ncbi:hypothetical protein TNCV_2663251 [Trichonephila clavipes]|nr:hypothetical protein TNCV_2663251 [Trichonephila clavipes]
MPEGWSSWLGAGLVGLRLYPSPTAFGKIKYLVQLLIVKAQVPPSGEEIGLQSHLRKLVYHLHGVDTSFREMYWVSNG